TEQFYDWERRGRGWRVWEESAYLEPPFRPFFHLPVNLTPPVDDGRRHTWASLLIEKVQDWMTGKRATPAPEPIEAGLLALLEEPEIPPYEDEEGLIELQVALPPTAKVTNDTFAAFLLSLAYCSHPLAFEVIGTSEAITVQLVCRESDAAPVKEQLRAHFPEARVTGAQTYLGDLWLENHEAPAVVVEFGLSEEFMLPLKTLPEARDPLVAITGALSQLREGEIGVLQVLFESVRHPWAESVFRAVTNWDGKAFFANAPEMVGWAKEKIRSPLYAAVVRVAAKSEEEERAWQIAKALGGGLAYLDHPHVNELIPLDNEGYDPVEHQVDLILRLTHRGGMLLNADELVSLVHLPTAAVKTPKLKRQVGKTKPAPKIVLGHSTLLGENPHEGQTMPVGLSADQRVKHTYVIGAPGTGKSTFFLNLALQDIQAGNGLAVLDPHGDLIDQILERIPEQRLKDVILLDPSDAEFPIGFNILSAHSEIEKHLLSSDLVGVFKRLSTSWGDQMTSVLGNAILAFLESERGGTLADLRRFLVGKKDREEFLQTVKDQEIRYYWQKEFPMLTGGKSLGPLLTRLDTFLRPKLIRHMVGQKENKLDFADIMNSGKIFLAKLSQGAIGEENAYLLGSLLVSKFHQLTLARQEQREADRRPFYLYVDEFHNFVTPSMASILSGARKYRLGLILAHQELRQLKNEEVASAVLANPYTRVC
ncbi:ATP-binding protein, partial [Candidatus Sumerlaeota bacterium]|nr:ATP-binding protein [Candidatus Sumerlaeota bacterium]